MGYYCTVPQCTSLAGKTKNVKFHRFPRDETLERRWNEILHRNKPVTKYSKVCSLHFTQADYNVTTMGQWKTLSKDAVPTMNLPKLNADGTVMVIRKSRSLKYKSNKTAEESTTDKREWSSTSTSSYSSSPGSTSLNTTFNTADSVQQHLSNLNALAANVSPQLRSILQRAPRPMKHDATMQTEPLDVSQRSELIEQPPCEDQPEAYKEQKETPYPQTYEKQPKNYSKDEFKSDDYSKEAEAYALDRSKRPSYEETSPYTPPEAINNYKPEAYKDQEAFKDEETYKQDTFKDQETYKEQDEYKQDPFKDHDGFKQQEYKMSDYKEDDYAKITEQEFKVDTFNRSPTQPFTQPYVKPQEYFSNSADVLRNQQHNLQVLQQQLQGERMQQSRLQQQLQTDRLEESRLQQQLQSERMEESRLQQQIQSERMEESRLQQQLQSERMEESRLQQQLQDDRMEDSRFYTGRIKEEIDLNNDEEKFVAYDTTQKENEYTSQLLQQQRLMDMYEARPPIKNEPDVVRGCDTVMQAQPSPLPSYYRTEHEVPVTAVSPVFYNQQREEHVQQPQYSQQPGAELLIAKQNALAATLWQNSMKRPFYYSDATHAQFSSGVLHSRYEDLNRLMNQ